MDDRRALAELMGRMLSDTGWRTVLWSSGLITVLEMSAWAVDLDQPGVWWTAISLTILVIARVLAGGRSGRPLRGGVSDAENATLLLAAGGLIVMEMVYGYTTVAETYASQTLYWPFFLTHIGVLVSSRLVAEVVRSPLNQWVLLYALGDLSLHMAFYASGGTFPSVSLTWSAMLTGVALAARWLVARDGDGRIMSPLNVVVGVFVVLMFWLQYGLSESGVGDSFSIQELFWPWTATTAGLALTVRVVAPWAMRSLSLGEESPSGS